MPASDQNRMPTTEWAAAVPDHLLDDMHAEVGRLLNVDGGNDEALDWLNDIISAVVPYIGRVLLDERAAGEQARSWVRYMADVHAGEACRYDHHSYCQTHYLDEHPCPVGQMIAWASDSGSTPPGGES